LPFDSITNWHGFTPSLTGMAGLHAYLQTFYYTTMDVRNIYISALKAADAGDYEPLYQFVES
jgi:hypothetical protein